MASKIAIAAASALAGGVAVFAAQARAAPADSNAFAMIDQLARVVVEIERGYVDPVDRRKLVDGAIKGMVAALDPHSAYLPPEQWLAFQNDTQGRLTGIGIEVDARDGRLVVIAPIAGSPAERAGIRSGDQVLRVDDVDATTEPLDEVMRALKGPPGSRVQLAIKRSKTGKLQLSGEGSPSTSVTSSECVPAKQANVKIVRVSLVREEVHVPSVATKLLDNGVGYLRIRQFQSDAHRDFVKAIAHLQSQAATSPSAPRKQLSGLLLDVRSNPGGLVDEAAEIADEFITAGDIFSMRHRGRVVHSAQAHAGGVVASLPTVALVDEWSASASELLVGALQDAQRARVVGRPTFGKGSVQSVFSLPLGAGLKLTSARYYTPNGRAIQAEGIQPDVVVALTGDRAALVDPVEQGAGDEAAEAGPREGLPIRVRRECDLPGHLAPEPSRRRAPGAPPAQPRENAPRQADLPLVLPVESMRGNPGGDNRDPLLREGYTLLLQAIADVHRPK